MIQEEQGGQWNVLQWTQHVALRIKKYFSIKPYIYIWLFYAFYTEFWKVILKCIKQFLICSRENVLCSDKVNTSTSVFTMINPYYLILHYWEVVLPWPSGHLGCQNCWGTSGSCLGMFGPHPDADLQHRPSQIQALVYRQATAPFVI